MALITAPRRWRQGDERFKVILSYRMQLRVTEDFVKKFKRKKRNMQTDSRQTQGLQTQGQSPQIVLN